MAPRSLFLLGCIGLLISPCPANSLDEEEDIDDPDPYLQLTGKCWGQDVTSCYYEVNTLEKRSLPFEEFYPDTISENQEIDKLEDHLIKSWKELDRMLFCTKLPMCVIR